MKITKNIGMILSQFYLIIDGLLGFGLNLGPAIFLLYVVALAAGIFILRSENRTNPRYHNIAGGIAAISNTYRTAPWSAPVART